MTCCLFDADISSTQCLHLRVQCPHRKHRIGWWKVDHVGPAAEAAAACN